MAARMTAITTNMPIVACLPRSFASWVEAPLRLTELATDKGAADCARTGVADIDIATAAAAKVFKNRILPISLPIGWCAASLQRSNLRGYGSATSVSSHPALRLAMSSGRFGGSVSPPQNHGLC